MAGYATVRAAVKTKLQTVSQLAFVYDFFKPDVAGYPAAIFDVSDTQNDFLTDVDNVRVISFKIYVIQEIVVKGLDEAANILDTTADAIVAAFEADVSLGSAVDWCEAMTGPRSSFQTPQGQVLTQELTLKCHFTALV